MQDDQLDKLFKNMQGEFASVNKRFDFLEENMATQESIDHLINTI